MVDEESQVAIFPLLGRLELEEEEEGLFYLEVDFDGLVAGIFDF